MLLALFFLLYPGSIDPPAVYVGRSGNLAVRVPRMEVEPAFFFANDMIAALREAGRVAKPDAPVVIQGWGAHERCDLEAMKQVARTFLPPRPPDAPPDPNLSRPDALRAIATEAGLTPEDEFDAAWAFEYPDRETLGRALVAVAGLATLVGPEREHELTTAIVAGLAPYRRANGSYRLSNEYHYLVARA